MKIMRRVDWVSFAIVAGLLLGSAGSIVILGTAESARADSAHAGYDYAQASVSYARAAQLLPWRTDLWEKAAFAAFRIIHLDDALSHLNHTNEHSEEGWVVLGQVYLQKDQLALAVQAFQNGLEAYPSSAFLYEELAFTHHLQQAWDLERRVRQEQVQRFPENGFAHYDYALVLSLVDTHAALAELAIAKPLAPTLNDAIETMRTTLNIAAIQTDEANKLVTIGRGLGLVQHWELARDAFQQATEADKTHAEAWAWLGEAEQQLGQDGSAALDQAIALNKESAIVRGLRGLQWSRQGDYDRMLAEYSLAARLEPENPAWQAAMGEAHLKLGDLAAAIGFYKRATELAPQESQYWRLLAMTCAENGAAVEEVALPAAQKAAELAPNDPAAWDALGFTYYASGRYASAEASLKTAIELDVNYYAAYIHLAMNYLTQGNNPAAYDVLIYVRDHDTAGYAERAKEMLQQYFP